MNMIDEICFQENTKYRSLRGNCILLTENPVVRSLKTGIAGVLEVNLS